MTSRAAGSPGTEVGRRLLAAWRAGCLAGGSAPAQAAVVRVWDGSWLAAIARPLWSPGVTARAGDGLGLAGLALLAVFTAWAFNASGGFLPRAVALSISLGIVAVRPAAGLLVVLATIPFVPDAVALSLTGGLVLSSVARRARSLPSLLSPETPAALWAALRHRLGTAVVLLALLLVVATLTSVDRAGSLRYLVVWLLGLALYGIVRETAADPGVLPRAALVLGLTGVLAGVYALYQVAVHVPAERAWIDVSLFPEVGTRAFAFWGNPNVFALHLVLTAPLLASGLWTTSGRAARAAVGAALVLVGLSLVLTLSRSGWLGLAVAVIFLGLLRDVRVVIAGVAAAAAALLVAPDLVLMRAATLARFDDPTAVHRIRIWQASIRMIEDFWWSGLGLGWRAFRAVYPQYAIEGRVAFHAHSHYFQTLLELGVIGFAALHRVILAPLWWAMKQVRRRRETVAGTVLIAAAAALLGALAFGLAEPIFYLPRPTLIAWSVVGLAGAAQARPAAEGGA